MRYELSPPCSIDTFGSLEEIIAVAAKVHRILRPEEERKDLEMAINHLKKFRKRATRQNMAEISLTGQDRLYIYWTGKEFRLNYNQRLAYPLRELYEKTKTAFEEAWKK